MKEFARSISAFSLAILASVSIARAADFNFYGRSGDAIEINLAALPGVPAGSTFGTLNTSGFSGHTVLTSDTLSAQPFASAGRFWVFANPARNTASLGDTNTAARGFQGALSGSVLVNGVNKTFSVIVQPSYTGSGVGAVGQSAESMGDATNNAFFVAQQQQRMRYLGFVPQGGAALSVTGDFDAPTDQATRTFQGAFTSGPNNYNTTQESGGAVDGIIGPNTAGWLNAANAASWDELIDPDPQRAGSFSTNTMIGNFDIYPGADPGTGNRTGNTPQPERFGTSWNIDVIKKGSALAKATTGRTQRINAMSRSDGYASSCCHNTHRVGMDIDLYTNSSTWSFGDGVRSAEEQIVINHAQSFINAAASGAVVRIITSNDDIYDGIAALNPTVPLFYDTSGGHQNHLHIDIGSPARAAGLANLAGDFNLDDVVDASDYIVWRTGLGATHTQSQFGSWRSNYGKTVTGRPTGLSLGATVAATAFGVPEPASLGLVMLCLACSAPFRCTRSRSVFIAGAVTPE